MSGKVRRLDYYPDEYIAGVGGVLSAEEQGVYWMVCSLIMSEGTAVRFDVRRLAGLCRIRPAPLKRIISKLVEAGKLTIEDDKIDQKRARNEHELASKRIQNAQENGMKGGRPRRKTQQNQQNAEPGGFSGEKLTTNYQPPTIDTSSNEDVRACRAPEPKAPTPRDELEKVLDVEHASAVIAHRNKLRVSLTPRAAKLLAGKFARCEDPNAAADVMIAAGWRGFEPEWMEGRTLPRGQGPPNGNGQRRNGMMDEVRRRLDDDDGHAQGEDQGDWGNVHPRRLSGTADRGH